MAEETSAQIFHLHQAPKKRPLTSAERGRAFRQRQREKKHANLLEKNTGSADRNVCERPANASMPSAENAPAGRPNVANAVRSWSAASALLTIAAVGLAAVGLSMNAWFARSMGATETAGWLFLAIGVAADLAALALPSCVMRLWNARQRGAALAGWAIWAVTFLFAMTAGIGFASTNISDVALARASRITPAIITAQTALSDAMTARDRECRGGVGRFCRERESTVLDRRQALDAAIRSVEQTADPQSEAAVKLVAWVSSGSLRPSGDDFGMLRIALLALLPQIGGVLLMLGRNSQSGGSGVGC
jgi:hypothetical protein